MTDPVMIIGVGTAVASTVGLLISGFRAVSGEYAKRVWFARVKEQTDILRATFRTLEADLNISLEHAAKAQQQMLELENLYRNLIKENNDRSNDSIDAELTGDDR